MPRPQSVVLSLFVALHFNMALPKLLAKFTVSVTLHHINTRTLTETNVAFTMQAVFNYCASFAPYQTVA